MFEHETDEHVIEALLPERKVENVGLKKCNIGDAGVGGSLPCHRE